MAGPWKLENYIESLAARGGSMTTDELNRLWAPAGALVLDDLIKSGRAEVEWKPRKRRDELPSVIVKLIGEAP
jgi:hypothetical protein